MAKWISEGGMFFPANERVGLTNNTDKVITNPSAEWSMFYNEEVQPGADYIYEGPCRDALKILREQGLEDLGFLGDHFTQNNDMIELARIKYNKTVEEYAEMMGYNKDKAKELAEKYKKQVFVRLEPKRVPEIKISGGGTNRAGTGGDKAGGLGDIPGK